MKFSNTLTATALAAFVASSFAVAQDDTAKELESAVRSQIENPRMQNLFRRVKEDPEGTVANAKKDPDALLRDAAAKFNSDQAAQAIEKVDTPENRAKAKIVADKALDAVSEMVPEAEKMLEEVPATRPANPTAIKATPVAVPLEAADTPAVPDATREMVVQEENVEPIATAEPTVAQVPESPTLNNGDVPDPEPLAPMYSTEPKAVKKKKKDGKESMEITSAESIFDQKGGDLTFKGNVFLDHPQFEMKCDTLVIEMGGGGTAMPGAGGMSNFSRAIASGGMVEMKTLSADGKTQIAMARRADYNKVKGMVTLSGGPPYIQDGDKFVQTTAEDAKIIMYMEEKRYEIIGDRSRIVIPMEGGDKTEGIFPGNALSLDR